MSPQRGRRRRQAHRFDEVRRGPSVGPVAVAAGVVAVLAVAVILLGGTGTRPSGSPSPSGSSAAVASSGGGSSASPSAGPSPSAAPSGGSPSPGPSGGIAQVAIVPVVDFRSTETAVKTGDVTSALSGGGAYSALELVTADADGILAALGATRPAVATRLILAKDAGTLTTDLAKARDRLAFLRADQITPAVRALAWGSQALFGVDRVRKAADWKLNARLALASGEKAFDPARTWTMVAGGDIMLDRGVAKDVKILGKGVDFPFDGGTATITGRACCSALHDAYPLTKRTGGAGAVRHLLKGADLAVANFENPAPDAFHYHTQGTVFSADPKLIAGLRDAGIDIVSIGNNHIGDAGAKGILDTIKNLRRFGIKSTGAGANLAAARQPAMVTVNGVKVAILGYDTIAKYYAAGPSKAGSAQLSLAIVKVDVARARKAGANLVIVYPHWGTEYSPRPFAAQQALARSIIDAGADMVIGNHAHWAGAMEIYKGKPIWYALGNFVFDQDWSEPTMEGITLEMSFDGSTLVQVRMRPHIILDKAQPNFMSPAGTGRVVLGQIYDASKKLLPW